MISPRRTPSRTRRALGACALLAVLMTTASACGDDDEAASTEPTNETTTEPTNEPSAEPSAETSAEPSAETTAEPTAGSTVAAASTDPSAGAFPVEIEHQLGTVTIEAEPQRVVAMTSRDADTLLALGVTPVGIHSRYEFESGVGPWAEDVLGDAQPAVWPGPEFNYEGIAAVDPDLIVYTGSGGDADVYDTLSAIAPVIDLPLEAVPYGATPEQSTLLIGQAVGRTDDAARVIAELEGYLAGQAAAHPAYAGRTANYLDVHSSGITSYSQDHIVNQILYSVGFAPITGSELPDGESSVSVSAENLSDFDADIVLAYPFGRTLDELVAETPTIGSLASYQDGGFVVLDDLALSNSSVLSIPYALERLMPQFDAALAGS